LKFGRKTTRKTSRVCGSRLSTAPTELISLIMSFAVRYPGAALPPKMNVRGSMSVAPFLSRW